jgi:hypothetical protein
MDWITEHGWLGDWAVQMTEEKRRAISSGCGFVPGETAACCLENLVPLTGCAVEPGLSV